MEGYRIKYTGPFGEEMYLQYDQKTLSPEAYIWKKEQKCANILGTMKKSSKPDVQALAKRCEIEKVHINKYDDGPLFEDDGHVAEQDPAMLMKAIDRNDQHGTDSMDPSIAMVRQFAKFCMYLDERIASCDQTIKEEEARQGDIMHLIEFNEIDDLDGRDIMQRLHESRVKRRNAKDRMCVLTALSGMVGGDFEELIRKIDGLKDRKYYPRIEADIFAAEEDT